MSGLFGGGKTVSMESERLATIQLQTSSYGGGIAIVYGCNRIAGNLVDYDDFTAVPHTTTQQAGKGGGGGSTISQTTYTYTAMVILALCEGPITSFNRVWRDKEVGSTSGWGFTTFLGNRTQAPWSYLTSKHPTKALGYAGTALACHSAVDLGSSGTLKNHSFEVVAFFSIPAGNPGTPDANPADIIPDFLSNPYYGATWDSSRIGDLTTYRTYCTAAGFFMSPVIDEQKPANEWLKVLLEATNSDPVWSSDGTKMVLKILPYGDQAITGNGATYTPNNTPLYDLGVDDFMPRQGEDPMRVEIVPQADSFNIMPVQFRNRALDYNTDVVEDPEPTDVDAFGPRRATVANLDCITLRSHALSISRIKAQRSVACRNRYHFRLGWKYILLEPMDLVTLTEPLLELDHRVVRIREIEETEDGYLEVMAEEWPFGVAASTAYTSTNGDGYAPNVNADPGNATAPVIFEPPPFLAESGGPEIWLATSGAPSLWGGCEVWVSTDAGASYSKVGDITQPARYGVTTAALASALDPDTTNTLAVDLTASKGSLASTDGTGRDAFVTLSLVENELVSFQTATLTAANKYNLTSLRRGAYGTAIGSHASGVNFLRLDSAVFKLPYDASLQGKILRIKLRSFNVWGGGLQGLASLTYHTFTPTGKNYPAPYNVTVAISDTMPD